MRKNEKSSIIMDRSLKDRIFMVLNYFICTLFMLICFYPMYYLFLVSISDSSAVAKGEVILWPVNFTLHYYKMVFGMKGIGRSFVISGMRTVLGTAFSLFMTSMLSYVIVQRACKLRKLFYRGTVATMYLSAGLIPWVVTYTMLGMQNSFWVYILPGAIYAYGMVLIKTYMESLPEALQEAALVDGAGYFTIFIRIILPLCKPVLAANALFLAVGQWNSFQDNFFLVQDVELQTVQMYLYNILKQAEAAAEQVSRGGVDQEMLAIAKPNAATMKVTTAMITILPILGVYPLLQRYFVKGIMVGAVKG